ncbi:hypothetical protein M3Y94_00682800 [Aphelenchoides besseyi]|nr:hypothetical protein M3Y94_00682800 [Aphelenchoides besseyi]
MPPPSKSITLFIGSCDLQFDLVSSPSNHKSQLILPGAGSYFYFPVPVKVSSSGITIGKGPDAKTLSCNSYKPTKESIVEFKIDSDEKISGLKITFDDATVFAGVHEDSQWGVNGWRLWASIGGGVVLLILVVVTIVGGIWYYPRYKKKQSDAKAAKAKNAKAPEKSSTAKKDKKDDDNDGETEQDGEKSKPFTQKFEIRTDALMQGQANKDGLKAPEKSQGVNANANGNGNVVPRGNLNDAPPANGAPAVNEVPAADGAPADNGLVAQLNNLVQNLPAPRQRNANPNRDPDGTRENIPSIE